MAGDNHFGKREAGCRRACQRPKKVICGNELKTVKTQEITRLFPITLLAAGKMWEWRFPGIVTILVTTPRFYLQHDPVHVCSEIACTIFVGSYAKATEHTVAAALDSSPKHIYLGVGSTEQKRDFLLSKPVLDCAVSLLGKQQHSVNAKSKGDGELFLSEGCKIWCKNLWLVGFKLAWWWRLWTWGSW